MAHELEYRDGRWSFFSVAETAWHRLGEVLVTAPTFEEAIKLGHLDYEVEKRETFFTCHTHDGDTYQKPSKTGFSVVRTDTQEELGTVGADYQPIQNEAAFEVLRPLVDQGVAQIETGGVIRNGADAWLLVRWDLTKFGPVVRQIFGDEVLPYGLVSTNHTGRRGVLLSDCNCRVVCANTLGFAERETAHRVMVKHSRESKTRLVDAAEQMWGGIIDRYEKLAGQYAALRETFLTEEQFTRAVLDVIAPHPLSNPKFNPDAKLAESVVERAEKRRAEVRRLWMEGKGHSGEPTAWFAYNGAVEAIDHRPDIFPTRAGSWRTASLLDGALKKAKDATLESLLQLTNA